MPEDCKLPKSFIDRAKPGVKNYEKVIQVLKESPLGEKEIMQVTNLKQTMIRVIKADLTEQGIIKEVFYAGSKKYEYQFNAPELDTKKFEVLREQKLDELRSIVRYVSTKKSRMEFLCNYLGDNSATAYRNCDNTTLTPFDLNPTETIQQKLIAFRESDFPSIAPGGVSAGFYGASNIGAALHRAKYQGGGDFPDFLLRLTLKAFRSQKASKEPFDFIMYIPPTESGNLVKNFAGKLSSKLKIPISHNLKKIAQTQPQKIFQISTLKEKNVSGKFVCSNSEEVLDKRILLFDDIYDSGATIKEVYRMLINYGAKSVFPLAIAKTVGGDIKNTK